jgi:hypothetical protein
LSVGDGRVLLLLKQNAVTAESSLRSVTRICNRAGLSLVLSNTSTAICTVGASRSGADGVAFGLLPPPPPHEDKARQTHSAPARRRRPAGFCPSLIWALLVIAAKFNWFARFELIFSSEVSNSPVLQTLCAPKVFKKI